MTSEQNNFSVLPKGWVWTKIGEIIKLEYGKGLRKDKRDSEGKIPVYGSNGIVGYHSKALVKKPCIIVGRKGAAGAVHLSKTPCWAIDTTYYVTAPVGINLDFLYYLFSSLNLQSLDKSTAIPGLNRNDAYATKIPLPPFDEQCRIVNRIEELFTKLDKATNSLEKVEVQLNTYPEAVLQNAFNGKLTKEWRTIHKNSTLSSTRLLTEIMREIKEKGGKYQRYFTDSDSPPIDKSKFSEVPETWTWTVLGKIRLNKSKSITPKKNPNKSFELYSVPSFEKKIPDIVLGKEIGSNKQIVEENTVLLCKINPRINRVWVVRNFTKHLKIASTEWIPFFRVKGINPEYLCFFMENTHFRHFLASNVSGVGGSLMRINTRTFANYFFPLPPLLEQEKIVNEVKKKFSIMQEVLKNVELSKLKAERLRSSILKIAFEGKLVAQNKNDEPADKLLEKIKKVKT